MSHPFGECPNFNLDVTVGEAIEKEAPSNSHVKCKMQPDYFFYPFQIEFQNAISLFFCMKRGFPVATLMFHIFNTLKFNSNLFHALGMGFFYITIMYNVLLPKITLIL